MNKKLDKYTDVYLNKIVKEDISDNEKHGINELNLLDKFDFKAQYQDMYGYDVRQVKSFGNFKLKFKVDTNQEENKYTIYGEVYYTRTIDNGFLFKTEKSNSIYKVLSECIDFIQNFKTEVNDFETILQNMQN